ncbi:titin [Culex quinquefasciatus]|uniref:titin n=1 Tax=Culex quinquefasciatus TaxID=7176 RepID=UPI0018E2E1EF|nr:titin [Culex quinquefasciatus]
MFPVSYGPPPAVPPSTSRNSLPVSYGPPGPYKSITVKQHLLNALHHIVDAINVAPEDLLRQITSWRPEIASKIEKIEALLRSLPAGRLKLLRDNADVAAIMQQLGVRFPEQSESDVEITIPDKPDRVDEGPKQDLEVIIKPDGVEIVKPDEQNPSELEVTVKPNGVEIVIPEKPDHVDEGKKVESSEHHSVEIVVTDKPEGGSQELQEAEIVVTPHSVVIEIPNKPDHVDEGPVKNEVSAEKLKAESPAASAAYEYDIPKGIEQLPLAAVPDNQYEVPEVPAPINSKEPAVLEATTELSETLDFEVTPSNLPTAQDVPVLPADARPFLSNSFRKKLLQAVTKALRSYQQKLGLTTRVPATQPPPKGKDEKLQELVQDTRSKIASMLKIIDKAAEDGKIPENLADEIDLNTPGILVQLSELEQLLGKDPNEPQKALPTKPDGTTDWGKILHGRDPPTGTRAPKKGKPEVVKASDDADE